MFFGIGLICLVVGIVMVRYFGASALAVRYRQLAVSDYVGMLLTFVGVVLMLGSIVVKLRQYMP